MATQPAVTRNPWAWVPTLYFAQGIPYVVVMTVSVILYKRLGISNTDIALYTSWLYLPWVLKPLWSPLVDLLKTKRLWIVVMQLIIGGTLASVALTIPLPAFFQYTLAFFWLMAFSSATHDIAADGFYMLGLEQHQQAAFVGVRSTFYRVAMITGQGILVVLAGLIESNTGLPPVELKVVADPQAQVQAVTPAPLPTATADEGPLRIITEQSELRLAATPRPKAEIDAVVANARATNIASGFYAAEAKRDEDTEPSLWAKLVSQPLEGFLRKHFPRAEAKDEAKGNVAALTLRLSGPPEQGSDVIVIVNRKSGDEGVSLLEGARLAFNADNWNQPATVVFQVDPKIRDTAAATFTATSGNIPFAWSITFVVLAAIFLIACIYHHFILPKPAVDVPRSMGEGAGFVQEFFRVFALFFRKRGILVIMAFLLFYRFAEAQLVKLITPFLLDSRALGGLGLSTSEVGFVYGTVGIIALTAGGLLGGWVVSRQGLKFWLWPMVMAIHLPVATFVYLSQYQPVNLLVINLAVAVEQFGYGFGFTAYMLYMIMVSEGEHKTAHYALCTGFMALGMMIPGMFSGWLADTVGYDRFFVWVLLCTIPGFVVAALVRVDPGFGRKKEAPEPQPVTEAAGAGLTRQSMEDETAS